jgi:CoA:oxalate CoA-transferase
MTFRPSADEATAPGGPLAGLSVVEATANIAGPSASLILADLGAQVTRIEPPEGDVTRRWPPFGAGFSTVHAAFNRGKQVRFLDLRTHEGVAEARELVAAADVFIESFRPGKAAQLGLGYDDLRALNPRLIYASVNGYGSVGPQAGQPGFDAVVQAYSGMMDLTGHPDQSPARVGVAALDIGAGMWTAIDVLAAVLQRQTTGAGTRVEATLLGTAAGFMMHHLAAVRHAGANPSRLGTAQHNFAPYQTLPTEDGEVMVGINSDRLWGRLCEVLDAADLATDARFATNGGRVTHRAELTNAIAQRSRRVTTSAFSAGLAEAGIPHSPVRTVAELAADPQLQALDLWGTSEEGYELIRAPVGPPRRDLGPALSSPEDG